MSSAVERAINETEKIRHNPEYEGRYFEALQLIEDLPPGLRDGFAEEFKDIDDSSADKDQILDSFLARMQESLVDHMQRELAGAEREVQTARVHAEAEARHAGFDESQRTELAAAEEDLALRVKEESADKRVKVQDIVAEPLSSEDEAALDRYFDNAKQEIANDIRAKYPNVSVEDVSAVALSNQREKIADLLVELKAALGEEFGKYKIFIRSNESDPPASIFGKALRINIAGARDGSDAVESVFDLQEIRKLAPDSSYDYNLGYLRENYPNIARPALFSKHRAAHAETVRILEVMGKVSEAIGPENAKAMRIKFSAYREKGAAVADGVLKVDLAASEDSMAEQIIQAFRSGKPAEAAEAKAAEKGPAFETFVKDVYAKIFRKDAEGDAAASRKAILERYPNEADLRRYLEDNIDRELFATYRTLTHGIDSEERQKAREELKRQRAEKLAALEGELAVFSAMLYEGQEIVPGAASTMEPLEVEPVAPVAAEEQKEEKEKFDWKVGLKELRSSYPNLAPSTEALFRLLETVRSDEQLQELMDKTAVVLDALSKEPGFDPVKMGYIHLYTTGESKITRSGEMQFLDLNIEGGSVPEIVSAITGKEMEKPVEEVPEVAAAEIPQKEEEKGPEWLAGLKELRAAYPNLAPSTEALFRLLETVRSDEEMNALVQKTSQVLAALKADPDYDLGGVEYIHLHSTGTTAASNSGSMRLADINIESGSVEEIVSALTGKKIEAPKPAVEKTGAPEMSEFEWELEAIRTDYPNVLLRFDATTPEEEKEVVEKTRAVLEALRKEFKKDFDGRLVRVWHPLAADGNQYGSRTMDVDLGSGSVEHIVREMQSLKVYATKFFEFPKNEPEPPKADPAAPEPAAPAEPAPEAKSPEEAAEAAFIELRNNYVRDYEAAKTEFAYLVESTGQDPDKALAGLEGDLAVYLKANGDQMPDEEAFAKLAEKYHLSNIQAKTVLFGLTAKREYLASRSAYGARLKEELSKTVAPELLRPHLYQKLILDENLALKAEKQKLMGPAERSLFHKLMDSYKGLSSGKKLLISWAIGAGGVALTGGAPTFGKLLWWAGNRLGLGFAAGAIGRGVQEGLAKSTDKHFAKKYEKLKQAFDPEKGIDVSVLEAFDKQLGSLDKSHLAHRKLDFALGFLATSAAGMALGQGLKSLEHAAGFNLPTSPAAIENSKANLKVVAGVETPGAKDAFGSHVQVGVDPSALSPEHAGTTPPVVHEGAGNVAPPEAPVLSDASPDADLQHVSPPGGAPHIASGAPSSAVMEVTPRTASPEAAFEVGAGFIETNKGGGDSFIRMAERQLSDHWGERWSALDSAEKTYALDMLRLQHEASDRMTAGAKVDFSSTVGKPEVMERLFEHVEALKEETKNSILAHNRLIEDFHKANPGVPLTTERVDAIIDSAEHPAPPSELPVADSIPPAVSAEGGAVEFTAPDADGGAIDYDGATAAVGAEPGASADAGGAVEFTGADNDGGAIDYDGGGTLPAAQEHIVHTDNGALEFDYPKGQTLAEALHLDPDKIKTPLVVEKMLLDRDRSGKLLGMSDISLDEYLKKVPSELTYEKRLIRNYGAVQRAEFDLDNGFKKVLVIDKDYVALREFIYGFNEHLRKGWTKNMSVGKFVELLKRQEGI